MRIFQFLDPGKWNAKTLLRLLALSSAGRYVIASPEGTSLNCNIINKNALENAIVPGLPNFNKFEEAHECVDGNKFFTVDCERENPCTAFFKIEPENYNDLGNKDQVEKAVNERMVDVLTPYLMEGTTEEVTKKVLDADRDVRKAVGKLDEKRDYSFMKESADLGNHNTKSVVNVPPSKNLTIISR